MLFKTNMAAGHGGSSGRYDYLREVAYDYAFLVENLPATCGALPALAVTQPTNNDKVLDAPGPALL